MSDSSESRQVNRGKLRRTSGADLSVAREVLKFTSLAVEPTYITQKQSIKALMPELFCLRNAGFSWNQLSELLRDACGIELLPSTVRSYFNEMLITQQEECTRRMNEQVLLLAEIRKETSQSKLPGIANRVADIIERQRKGEV